jgi:site-specific DNA-methyltransferase (adenine-specific)
LQTIQLTLLSLTRPTVSYGTTACKWDTVIPLEPMWEQLKRIIKPNGAIVLFGSQPFTSALVMSNPKMFKYEWVWDKHIPRGFQVAKYRPMNKHENISIFCDGKTTYNPQMTKRDIPIKGGGMTASDSAMTNGYKALKKTYTHKNPTTLIQFDKIRKDSVHPTQKPVALMEYLIKTYTNEGETVLDFTAGSGTLGVAAINTNRNAILIERDTEYCEIIKKRITEAEQNKANRLFAGE